MSFAEIITYPFSWLLLTLYEMTGSYGLSILLFALVVKLIMLPFQMKSKRSMMRMSRLNPYMQELQKKYEGNQQKYQQEVAKLYKEEKVNPMSGCLWSLIPFPILIALYSVIRQPLTRLMRVSTEAVTQITDKLVTMGLYTVPEKADAYYEITLSNLVHDHFSDFQGISDKLVDLDWNFLGINLGVRPEWNFFTHTDWSDPSIWGPALGLFLVPVISALLSYFSMKVSNAANPGGAEQQSQMKGMLLTMPLVSLYICFIMPAALGVYWIANSLFAMIQDLILNKVYNKQLDAEDAERRERLKAKEIELEKKRLETEKLRAEGATERNKNTSKKKLQAAEKAQMDEREAAARAEERAKRRKALGLSDEEPASQVGSRRYARGRAYVPDRFTNPEGAEEATREAAEESAIDDEVNAQFDAAEKAENDAEN